MEWEDDIKMDLKEIGIYAELDCFGPGYELQESPCECGIEPLDCINHVAN